ncbi:cyclic AMP response element-binding protein A-like isoform X2 [Lycorma delicatula]|uniref:cyclic AMP response element-binding protein A-like isoform X2 n=1 Tax=Lycorma delicatula TaxID=130591 RepID=UPI003F512984
MWKMETFSVVEKSFYDIAESDLKELWDPDLDPTISEVLEAADKEWQEEVKPQVILHDRLMTDAALGTAPIKAEHSYCSLVGSSETESHLDMNNDMDEGCFTLRRDSTNSREGNESPIILIKDEPMSEPDSPMSSCPASPPASPSPPAAFSEYKSGQSLLKQPTAVLRLNTSLLSQQTNHIITNVNIKVEPNTSGFTLPPTPPSSTSSDSEGNVSPAHSSSPSRRLFQSAATPSTRQPIQTPLISSQPKGSTGVLHLTEEEKRTLLAEGYPIPTRLPLTKAEEKSLKKIRRKIKNKISAQESRRKKKEYMDALERKVELLSSENSEFRKKITTLEDTNNSLVSQLNKLQALLARSTSSSHVHVRSTHK